MHYQALKERHRQERDQQHPNLSLRLHRALSWLNRAEQAEDTDGRFIFLWIAFNAAYATDIVSVPQRHLPDTASLRIEPWKTARYCFSAPSRRKVDANAAVRVPLIAQNM
ncbi:hypothetical protein ACYJKZ_006435, partial [Pseudomonas aeruginosa]